MTTSISLMPIGGPTVRLTIGGFRFLTDPTLDAAGGAYPVAPQITLDKVLGPILPPEGIGPIDAVLLSHDQHADNLDARGRALLAHVPVVFTTISGAERLGGSARGLSPWESTTLGEAGETQLVVTAVPGRHGPPGCESFTGDVVGFVIDGSSLSRAVYVTGDTVFYEALPPIAERFAVGLVVLHLGHVRGPDGSALTMSSDDIASIRTTFANATIVPVHYDGWRHFTEGEAELRASAHAADLHFLARGVDTVLSL